MIETDKTVFEKMVGIWSITQIPQLKMVPNAGKVKFTWAKGLIAEMEFQMFFGTVRASDLYRITDRKGAWDKCQAVQV